MCTIGAIRRDDKTFLLKNFDYDPFPATWTLFEEIEQYHAHFALVNHNQQGVNSGFNESGLGLIISQSDPVFWSKKELRTVLNADVLSRCKSVEQAVRKIKKYSRVHPAMMGGNVIMGDKNHIAIVEYFRGKARSGILNEGWIARANHSVFEIYSSSCPLYDETTFARYFKMILFLGNLYDDLSSLSREEVMARCKKVLRRKPLLNKRTMSSFVMDMQSRRVDYIIGSRKYWKTFRF